MIGDRMRQARLAAGLTLNELAERLKELDQPITSAGLSKYEQNKSTPKAALLLKLAQALGVKSSYFFAEPGTTIHWLAFRKHSTLPVRQQAQIQAVAVERARVQLWLQRTLYPNESPRFPAARATGTPREAEAAANHLRRVWQIGSGPIESLTQTVEDHGGIVIGWSDTTDGFDGLAGWLDNRIPVAVVNQAVSDDRRRFDLAHELGHLLMRCDGLDTKTEEGLAHRFASAFLVPAEAARHELGMRRRRLDFDELGLLKRKYGLSMQAWARRACDLEIIDEGHYRTWCVEFSSRGWRKIEPYRFEGDEEPVRLKQLTLHALAEGIITEERAQELCPGCLPPQEAPRPAEQRYTARELMTLPRAERDRILAAAAAEAAEEYDANPALSEFEAFGEDDLYDDYPE